MKNFCFIMKRFDPLMFNILAPCNHSRDWFYLNVKSIVFVKEIYFVKIKIIMEKKTNMVNACLQYSSKT